MPANRQRDSRRMPVINWEIPTSRVYDAHGRRFEQYRHVQRNSPPPSYKPKHPLRIKTQLYPKPSEFNQLRREMHREEKKRSQFAKC